MQIMNCKQLGGTCDKEFHANSFEEIAEMSKEHVKEMFQRKDEAHLNAIKKMQELMKFPGEMEKWFEARHKEYEALIES